MRQKILDMRPDHPIVLGMQPLEFDKKPFVGSRSKGTLPNDKLVYREVLNDGNSFYRAIGILYLSSRRKTELTEALPDYSQLNLEICPAKHVPLEVRPYYSKQNLINLLETSWGDFIQFYEQFSPKDYEYSLCEFLNSHIVLDFLLILYVRAVTSRFIMKGFEDKTWKNIGEVDVCQYGKECPDNAIKAVSRSLSLNLQIYSLTRDGFSKEEFYSSPVSNTVTLILKDSRYGIVTKNFPKQPQLNTHPIKGKNEPVAEPTRDCERCPYMKNGKCFNCSMLNFESPAYNRIVLGIDVPKKKDIDFELVRIELAPAPKALPKAIEPPKEPLKCVECEALLKKQQEQFLICGSCSKDAKMQERIHEHRSKTLDKIRSPPNKDPRSKPIKPSLFEQIAPINLGGRYADLRRRPF